MKFTDIFIKRPVLAICINLLILIAGFQAYQNVNVRQYPRSDLAKITVKTAYIGANADLVRGFVATPLERAIASADGVDYLESESVQGLSTITAHLRLNFDVNAALSQVQTKINQVRNDLPPEAESPTVDVESSDNRFAAMYLSFYSKDLDQSQITDYLTRVVQPRLAAVKGVQKAEILGARTFAMRIWLKPEKMAAFNVSGTDIRRALADNNYLAAVGQTKGSMISVNLTANTDLRTKREFEDLIVRRDADSMTRLSDVADIVLGAENYDQDVRFSGESATFMGIWALPNANSLDVIERVRTEIPDIERNVPSGMKVGIPYDSTAYIRDALHEVVKTLGETVVIVVIVIFLFIGSFRGVLVPVVAIPLSLIGALAVMWIMGFSLNLLTLLAIVLAVGLVVDDAIVMLENIERHVADGMKPLRAAVVAARELVGPTIAMTITLAAVYAPIGIQGGLTGTLFREFAFTLAGAVLISGVVALTLSPMMSSRLLRQHDNPSKLKLKSDQTLERMRVKYAQILRTLLNYRVALLTGSFLFILLIPVLYMGSTKELAPREDQGVIFGAVTAAPNSSLEQTMLFTTEVNRVYQEFPEYKQTFQLTFPTQGFSGMLTKPWSERSRTTAEIEPEMWGKMSKVPGIQVFVFSPAPLPGGSDFPIEMVISSTGSPLQLFGVANEIVAKARKAGLFTFIDSDLKYDLPQSEIVLDREKIAELGLTLRDVGEELAVYTGGNYVNRFSIDGRSYKVIPQVKRSDRLTPEQLTEVYVKNGTGQIVPISTFATIENSIQPRKLNRFQQMNSVKIQGGIIPIYSIDDGLKFLEKTAKETMPAGWSVDYAGESRQLRKEGSSLVTTLLLAIILIFLVLAAQFESFRDPLIILAGSVPLALAGSMIFVFLNGTSMNIYSQVGLVTLVGLVAKNGILIVEFTNKLREKGLEKFDAVIEAASTRMRPVLMTSVATVVGHFPLVLASGAGAGARNSIGIVLVSGMIIGTLFTLFVLPAIYVVFSGERKVDNTEDAWDGLHHNGHQHQSGSVAATESTGPSPLPSRKLVEIGGAL